MTPDDIKRWAVMNVRRFHNVYIDGLDDDDVRRHFHDLFHNRTITYDDCPRCGAIRLQ